MMRYKPSTFYSNFSVAQLVKKDNSNFGVVSGVGMGGGGGGGMGTGSHFSGSKEARYSKTDSFSCHLKSSERSELDESKVMQSLKATIEQAIIDSGASITKSSDLPSGFSLEYNDEDIQGRIELTGNLSGANYLTLTANLIETSTSEKQPVIERRDNVRQPRGDYHVVPFMHDDPRASAQSFHARGQQAIKESIERMRQKLLADYSKKDSLFQNLEYVEVYVWTPMSADMKQLWKEAMGEEFEVPAEYDQYEKVYFLNEVALQMYREAGEDFEVLKTISADEMAKIPGPSLRGPYLAKGL